MQENNGRWTIPWMSNMHDHYRFADGMMEVVIPEAARQYCHATAMPNFKDDRIRTPEQAFDYRERVLAIGRKVNPQFDVNVPLYLEETTDPTLIKNGFDQGAWISAKLYPKGGTTNSDEGVDFRNMDKLDPQFAMMADIGMKLLIHAEPQFEQDGAPIDPWDREGKAHAYLTSIFKKHPKLKVVVEHVSTAGLADLLTHLKAEGYSVGATVAPQYLEWNRATLLKGGMNPGYYSIPVLQREEDRTALVDFMVHGDIAFLGTDCAPHPAKNKAKFTGCPGGVFNNPAAFNVYFKHFKNSGLPDWLERFVQFACVRGPRFYGVEVPTEDALVITEEAWTMSESFGEGDNLVIPMYAGQQMQYSLKPLNR